MGRDEVDRRERVAAVVLVEIARARQALGELPHVRLAAPEVAHRVAVHPVPLRPQDREVADLVAARADVPGLGDQLDLREHRVLVDDVEERAQAVDVVELSRQGARQVEAEAVDVAVDHPVAQRVHDQPQHARVHDVERVAGARVVHVVAQVVGHEPVVGGVVDAAEGQHRAEVVALGGVVVDDVEDDLDAGVVQRLDHALELAHLLARLAGGGVGRVRREEADRGVAPVVRQPALGEEGLVGDVVDGQQLHGGHAEAPQIVHGRIGGHPGVGAAQVLAHLGKGHREALDVGLVDDAVGERRVRRPVVLPVEARVDDHGLRDRRRVVGVVGLEVVVVTATRDIGMHVGLVEQDRPVDRLRVRVEQQLGRIEAVAGARVIGSVDAVPVVLSGVHAGDVAVPVERRPLGHPDAPLDVPRVEQA